MRFTTSAVCAITLLTCGVALPSVAAFSFVPQSVRRAKFGLRQGWVNDATRGEWKPLASDVLESAEKGAEVTGAEPVDSDATSDEEQEPLVLEEVPPASHSLEQSDNGPSGSRITTLTVNLGAPGHPEPIVIETGKVGRQAAGAVTLTRGDTVLYATAARDASPKEGLNFLPLSVEHSERFSAAGVTSGSFNKRDGRPAEHEILTCRLIDRPLRPLMPDGWRHETQLIDWVLSYDGLRSCDPLAITASAAALWISDIPLSKPVAAAQVGYIDGQYVLNPTLEQMDRSRLNLIVAGTKDGVLMIEGAADFLPEDIMVEAVSFGHEAIKVLCGALEDLGEAIGKPKIMNTLSSPADGLQEAVNEMMADDVMNMYIGTAGKAKEDAGDDMKELQDRVCDSLEEDYPEQRTDIKNAFKDLLCRQMFALAKDTGKRCDGRALDEVRRIDAEAGFLPRVHGSALFTRGETQSIATTTLGDSGMKQKIDKLDGMDKKRFYLQYTFPPSCVGETGRIGMPGRREVGHGNLAERALAPILPSEEDFPYSIRVESLITESHGSSSMASVCGGCLSLMDAGVPIKSPVAGIAMGMLLGDKGGISDENAVIVSDILGTEDALGTMDFKVAGDREGITTFQLDIKCEGLTIETMTKALAQAREGRLHILDEMEKCLSAARGDLPNTVPKIGQCKIPEDTIGKVIGPGGKQIRAIIEDFELTNMDVGEDGTIQLSAMNTTKIEMADAFIKNLIAGGGGPGGRRGGRGPKPQYAGPEPEVGKIYNGKITGIHDFGVFVEIIPGAEDGSTPGCEGLCHVSELHVERVRNCPGFVAALNTENIEVKLLGKNDKGKYSLSRKAVLEERGVGVSKGKRDYGKGKRTAENDKEDDTPPAPEMSTDEMKAISKAIEEISEL